MIATKSLRKLSRARLADAEALLRARRYDGAVYVAGYAVELALKARMCKTLRWSGFPEAGKELEGLRGLHTHDLDVLLKLSGREKAVKTVAMIFADWSVVASWDPSARYKAVGTANRKDTASMLEAVKRLLKHI